MFVTKVWAFALIAATWFVLSAPTSADDAQHQTLAPDISGSRQPGPDVSKISTNMSSQVGSNEGALRFETDVYAPGTRSTIKPLPALTLNALADVRQVPNSVSTKAPVVQAMLPEGDPSLDAQALLGHEPSGKPAAVHTAMDTESAEASKQEVAFAPHTEALRPAKRLQVEAPSTRPTTKTNADRSKRVEKNARKAETRTRKRSTPQDPEKLAASIRKLPQPISTKPAKMVDPWDGSRKVGENARLVAELMSPHSNSAESASFQRLVDKMQKDYGKPKI